MFMALTSIYVRLDFGKGPAVEPGGPPVVTNEILAMISPEQERVPLQKVRKRRKGRNRERERDREEEGAIFTTSLSL